MSSNPNIPEMISRVALAIANAPKYDFNAQARCAIMAMREETKEMEEAAFQEAVRSTEGTVKERETNGPPWPLFLRPRVLWRAMIKQALDN